MQIELIRSITPEHVEAFARLLPQQSPGARHPTAEQLTAVANQQGNSLLIARDDQGKIVGTLTLMILVTRIFAAYYGEDETGLTCILGSSFRLP